MVSAYCAATTKLEARNPNRSGTKGGSDDRIPSDSLLDDTNCNRRTFVALAGLVFCTGVASALHAQQLEKSLLRLGVGNKSHLYYLPLTLFERRHHFKDYGLDVAIADFEGGGEARRVDGWLGRCRDRCLWAPVTNAGLEQAFGCRAARRPHGEAASPLRIGAHIPAGVRA